mgnify:CR=1 FL=1
MKKQITLPDLGEGIDNAEVSEVSVSVGDSVEKNDTLIVLESDKASMEIPAEDAGVVLEVLINPGDEVSTGQPLLSMELASSGETTASETTVPKKQVAMPDKPILYDGRKEGFLASPGVRRLARELNIDLRSVPGTGLKGRTTKDDLNSYIRMRMDMGGASIKPLKKEVDFSKWGEIEFQKLTKINRLTGSRLQQSWQEIPLVTQYESADITELDQLRKKLKADGEKKEIKVTFLPFLMKAAAVVLKEMPRFNSSLDSKEENLVLKSYYNIGVAVDTPSGLVVPSIKDVNKKTIFDLSKELMDISARARDKKLKPDEMSGSTFTISSLGGIGGSGFSPIVNPPEVAILGVSKSEWKPVYSEEKNTFLPRYILPLSLSYDHRVIDGASGALFVRRLSEILNDMELYK